MQLNINEEEVQQLHPLIGCSLQDLTLHHTDVELRGPHHVLSPSVSLQMGSERSVVVENEWKATPGGWDYGQFTVRIADQPPSAKWASDKGSGALNILRMKPHQSVPPVKKIDIFEHIISSGGSSGPSYDSEHVRYDAAIVFRREDHSTFRFSPEEGLLGRVEFCQLWSDIRDISVRLKRRVMITKEGIDFDPPPA